MGGAHSLKTYFSHDIKNPFWAYYLQCMTCRPRLLVIKAAHIDFTTFVSFYKDASYGLSIVKNASVFLHY